MKKEENVTDSGSVGPNIMKVFSMHHACMKVHEKGSPIHCGLFSGKAEAITLLSPLI